ncbi:MAG: ChbG/HpnK family deacetylase [Alphaproteobacteria bacterium]|nr:ChbG/HpnK family deacetylase [Alphaproteobacteria bacterium]
MDDDVPHFSFKLCADDFALSPGVSRAILLALSAGRLTATSVMANQPDWPMSAPLLQRHRASAEIGLHLNLTLGRPLTDMPVFAPSGQFPSLAHVIRSSFLRTLPEQEIRAEIAAQLAAFIRHWGGPPDFVDGHQHVQGLPQISDYLLEELAKHNLPSGFWLRQSADHLTSILARKMEWPKALIVSALTASFARKAKQAGFALNDGFAGFSSFKSDGSYAKGFASYLTSPGPQHLIMCHPGIPDDALRSLEDVVESRQQELDFLLSAQFETVLKEVGAELKTKNPAH